MEQKEKDIVFEAVEQFQKTQNVEYYNTIYNLIYPEVYARIVTLAKTKGQTDKLSSTDDILSQVMLKVWNNLNLIEEKRAFFKWLNVTIEHTCYDEWGTARNRKEIAISSFTTNDEESDEERSSDYVFDRYDANEEFNSLNNNERQEIIRGALGELDGLTAEIINKFYFEDLSTKDIAYALDMNESTVRSKLRRGRISLAESMERESKKRGFKLYNLSFFGMFLFLHDKSLREEMAIAVGGASTSASKKETHAKETHTKHAKAKSKSASGAATAKMAGSAGIGLGRKVLIAVVTGLVLIGGGVAAKIATNKSDNSSNNTVAVESDKPTSTTEATAEVASTGLVTDFSQLNSNFLSQRDARAIDEGTNYNMGFTVHGVDVTSVETVGFIFGTVDDGAAPVDTAYNALYTVCKITCHYYFTDNPMYLGEQYANDVKDGTVTYYWVDEAYNIYKEANATYDIKTSSVNDVNFNPYFSITAGVSPGWSFGGFQTMGELEAAIAESGFNCEYHLTDDDPIETPTASAVGVDPNAPIGSLLINVESGIVIQDAPTWDSNSKGTAGCGKTYDVYEVKEADGFTWYRIVLNGSDWVANSGGWATYTPNSQQKKEHMAVFFFYGGCSSLIVFMRMSYVCRWRCLASSEVLT